MRPFLLTFPTPISYDALFSPARFLPPTLSAPSYGWRALPKNVPAAQMEALLAKLGPAEQRVARRWYRRDANCAPDAAYTLRSCGGPPLLLRDMTIFPSF